MNATSHKPRTFRPWPDNEKKFHVAQEAGLNVSELLNELCARHWQRHVALKTRIQSRAVSLTNGRAKRGAR